MAEIICHIEGESLYFCDITWNITKHSYFIICEVINTATSKRKYVRQKSIHYLCPKLKGLKTDVDIGCVVILKVSTLAHHSNINRNLEMHFLCSWTRFISGDPHKCTSATENTYFFS